MTPAHSEAEERYTFRFQKVTIPGVLEGVWLHDEVLLREYKKSLSWPIAWIMDSPWQSQDRWLCLLPGRPDQTARFRRIGDARAWLKREMKLAGVWTK